MMGRCTGLLAVCLLVVACHLTPLSAVSVDPNIVNTRVDRKVGARIAGLFFLDQLALYLVRYVC